MRFKIWFLTWVYSTRDDSRQIESFEGITAKSWNKALSYSIKKYGDALIRIERTDGYEYPTVEDLLKPCDGGG